MSTSKNVLVLAEPDLEKIIPVCEGLEDGLGCKILVSCKYEFYSEDASAIAALRAAFGDIYQDVPVGIAQEPEPKKHKAGRGKALTVNPDGAKHRSNGGAHSTGLRTQYRVWQEILPDGSLGRMLTIDEKNELLARGGFQVNSRLKHPRSGLLKISGLEGSPQTAEPIGEWEPA